MWVRSNISSLLHCQQGAFNAFKYFQRALLPLWIHFSWKFVCLLFEFHVFVSCPFVAIYLVVGWEKIKEIASQTNNWAAWLQSSWPIQARVPWLLIQTPPIFFIFLSAKTQALLRTQKTIYKTSPHFQLSSHCLCQCYEYNHFKFNFNLTICFRKLLWIIVITHCCHKPFFCL